MTLIQQIITIAMVVLGTIITRLLSFAVFPSGRPTPKYVQDLGILLPSAVLGLLVIYCFKDVKFQSGSHGIPELIAVGVVALLHIWKKNMLLSIAGGTIIYMVLVQIIF
ncbi:hypothetical protein SPSIL_035850 [Sporomusa silvacetica DSM 10669]|uniref:Branched-chain amino acid transport protein AzlD n=1 Tax=Sporomusa silvacetica DSM 10669 TaxID=1123289 RepID=A0ABZ3INY4_9FIRM|nr:branched-chain amino acid transporter permease [Sporomusa silvacetica]OZC14049.1 branched-chain amino acid transport protein AzlD [Sporomusa silvacetica DSM 10669]